MTAPISARSYDEVPYPNLSYAYSHPNHLATLATLLGMDPPPINGGRVLELGCASGGNLAPMAYSLPKSEFVGIDASGRQIATGQEFIRTLELKNIVLKAMDIRDVTRDLGQFDYVIAHGVYSWVPEPVRDKLLKICQDHLTPNGVAYISYNTYPGWHMLGIVRDMMLYHTRRLTEPHHRVREAQELLKFMAQAVPDENSAYGSFLQTYEQLRTKERAEIHEGGDAALLHDELEEINQPVYFYQFAEHASRYGLQYLAEAKFPKMLPGNFPPQVVREISNMSQSVVDLEQYMDFLRNRTFRQTLLCRQAIPLRRTLKPEHVRMLSIASPARLASDTPDVRSVSVETFQASDGTSLSTEHPATKAAMLYLAEIWPRAVPFDRLLMTARSRLSRAGRSQSDAPLPDEHVDAEVLGTNLLMAYGSSNRLVEFYRYPPEFVTEVSSHPTASPVARLQAQQGAFKVTNLRHERTKLNDFQQLLLPYLDGNRDRQALLETLSTAAAEFMPGFRTGGPGALARELDLNLRRLTRMALLVG